jgi:hypothetical protein
MMEEQRQHHHQQQQLSLATLTTSNDVDSILAKGNSFC